MSSSRYRAGVLPEHFRNDPRLSYLISPETIDKQNDSSLPLLELDDSRQQSAVSCNSPEFFPRFSRLASVSSDAPATAHNVTVEFSSTETDSSSTPSKVVSIPPYLTLPRPKPILKHPVASSLSTNAHVPLPPSNPLQPVSSPVVSSSNHHHSSISSSNVSSFSLKPNPPSSSYSQTSFTESTLESIPESSFTGNVAFIGRNRRTKPSRYAQAEQDLIEAKFQEMLAEDQAAQHSLQQFESSLASHKKRARESNVGAEMSKSLTEQFLLSQPFDPEKEYQAWQMRELNRLTKLIQIQ